MEPRAYDEDWRRTVAWEHDALRLIRRYLRRRQVGPVAGLPVVMVANPIVLAIGRHWRRRSCPCCGWRGFGFLWAYQGRHVIRDSICPHCESRPRHRALTLLIPAEVAARSVHHVLHFAPEPLLQASLRDRFPDAEYRTTDLLRDDVDLPAQDIQALTLPDASADLVVCNHVLEHVPDDHAAVAELARITTADGIAFVTVPGNWTGRPTVSFSGPDENGHLRDYGADVADLLGRSFEHVQPVTSASVTDRPRRYGIREQDPIFVCRHKPPSSPLDHP